MNLEPDFHRNGKADESLAGEWRELFATWRRLLAQCGKQPSRKLVHELRIATLRLQALLAFRLKARTENQTENQAERRWNKQARKLRHALQQARSPEVYLRKLEWLRAQAGGQTAPDELVLRQIARLERRFARQRNVAEKELIERIARRRPRLERWSKEIEGALVTPTPATSGMTVLRELTAALAAGFPALSADCLHEFRKRVKNLRYLAEFFAIREPLAAQQAERFAQMQAAIGEWRDWQLLSKEARHILKDRESVLTSKLAALEAKSLRKALTTCRRVTAQLLKDNAAETAHPRHAPRKIPVQSDVSPASEEVTRSA